MSQEKDGKLLEVVLAVFLLAMFLFLVCLLISGSSECAFRVFFIFFAMMPIWVMGFSLVMSGVFPNTRIGRKCSESLTNCD